MKSYPQCNQLFKLTTPTHPITKLLFQGRAPALFGGGRVRAQLWHLRVAGGARLAGGRDRAEEGRPDPRGQRAELRARHQAVKGARGTEERLSPQV